MMDASDLALILVDLFFLFFLFFVFWFSSLPTGTNGRKCIGNSWNCEAAPYSGAIILHPAAAVVRTVVSLQPPITRCWPGQPGTSWMTGNSSITLSTCSFIHHLLKSWFVSPVFFFSPIVFDGSSFLFGTHGIRFLCRRWMRICTLIHPYRLLFFFLNLIALCYYRREWFWIFREGHWTAIFFLYEGDNRLD